MHGEDHRRRSARGSERRADIRDVARARAVTAEFRGYHHAEQFSRTQSLESLGGKTRFTVHGLGVPLRDLSGFFGPLDEIAPLGVLARANTTVDG